MAMETVYSFATLERKIKLPLTHIDSNIKSVLEKKINKTLEGKCTVEGFIKKDSCVVTTYSSGLVTGNSIEFVVIFKCELCTPVEGMIITCNVDNITKAGIKASIPGEYSPITVFIVRDHHHRIKEFSSIKVGEMIKIRVIGQRYELNDEFISVIGELLLDKDKGKQPRIVFKDN